MQTSTKILISLLALSSLFLYHTQDKGSQESVLAQDMNSSCQPNQFYDEQTRSCVSSSKCLRIDNQIAARMYIENHICQYCPPPNYVSKGECKLCPPYKFSHEKVNKCLKVSSCPKTKGASSKRYYVTEDNKCTYCDHGTIYNQTDSHCQDCKPDEITFLNDNICHPKTECKIPPNQENRLIVQKGKCVVCDATELVDQANNKCEKCPQNEYPDTNQDGITICKNVSDCQKDKSQESDKATVINNKCVVCPNNTIVKEEKCVACSNNEMTIGNQNYCHNFTKCGEFTKQPEISLKRFFIVDHVCQSCPVNTINVGGICTPCAYSEVSTLQENDCRALEKSEICYLDNFGGEPITIERKFVTENHCYTCQPPYFYNSTSNNCQICPPEQFTRWSDNGCHTARECTQQYSDLCVDRYYVQNNQCKYCLPPFYQEKGSCIICGDNKFTDFKSNVCKDQTQCPHEPGVTIDRYYVKNNMCTFCPEGTIKGNDNRCQKLLLTEYTSLTTNVAYTLANCQAFDFPQGTNKERKYIALVGNLGKCSFCAPPNYLDINTNTCIKCPNGTVTTDMKNYCFKQFYKGKLSNCTSNPSQTNAGRYFQSGLSCMQCEPPFISSISTAECIMCNPQMYTDSNNNECKSREGCPNSTQRSYIEENECKVCNSDNYFVDNRKCIECPLDTVSNGTSANQCLPAVDGCIAQSNQKKERFYIQNHVCLYCSGHRYLNQNACIECPSDQFINEANYLSCQTVSACPKISKISEQRYYVKNHICLYCAPPYINKNGVCEPCPPNLLTIFGTNECSTIQ